MTVRGAAFSTIGSQHSTIAFAAPPVTTYEVLLDGDAGTFRTLDAMRDAVLGRIPPDYSGYQDPYNIRAAKQICAHASGQTQRAQIAALFNWVISNITYTPHPLNQQTLQDARRTLELKAGDCVSLSVLLATLLASLGYTPRLVAQWLDGESASHVYIEVLQDDGDWLALDAVASDQPVGWRQPTLDSGFEVAWEIF